MRQVGVWNALALLVSPHRVNKTWTVGFKRGRSRRVGQMGKALNLLDAGDRADNVSVLDAVRHALGANYGKVIDVFRDIDANGDGFVSKKEFRRVLPVLGVSSTSEAECDALFDELDTDHSGKIDYREMNSKLRVGQDELIDASLQAGAAGVIDVVSVNKHALRGGKLNEDINTTFGGNTILTLDHEDGMEVSKQLRLALTSNMAKVVDLFKEWDINHDGRISKVEFRRSITRLLDERPPKEAVDALFDEMDADRGGTIEYRELYKLLRRRKSDGPRKPLWAAKAAKPKTAPPDDGRLEIRGGVLEERVEPDPVKLPPPPSFVSSAVQTKAAKSARKLARSASHGGLSLARAEAILLGQMIHCPTDSVKQSRRRVVELTKLGDNINRTAERDLAKQESINRFRAQAEKRIRAQRSKSAEGRQAEMIMATGAFVARASRPSQPPDQEGAGPSGMTTSAIDRTSTATPGSPTWQMQSTGGFSATSGLSEIRRPGTAISITDEYFKPSSLLESPWNTHPESSWNGRWSPSGRWSPEKASRGASRGSGGGSPPSPGAGGPPSPGSPSRREREEIQAFPAHIPPRAMWREDVGKQIAYLRVPSSREGSEASNPRRGIPHFVANSSAKTSERFAASLRAPTSPALMYMMPRPHLSEAHRCGFKSEWIPSREEQALTAETTYLTPEKRAKRDAKFAEIEARVNGTFFAPVEGGLRFKKIDKAPAPEPPAPPPPMTIGNDGSGNPRFMENKWEKDRYTSTRTREMQATAISNTMEDFARVDADGDEVMNFDEFKKMVDRRMPTLKPRSPDHIRLWFDALDLDGNGEVSFEEFFSLSLREGWERAGYPSEFAHIFSGAVVPKNAHVAGADPTPEDFFAAARKLGFTLETSFMKKIASKGKTKFREFLKTLSTPNPKAQNFLLSASQVPGARWCLVPEERERPKEVLTDVSLRDLSRVKREEPIVLPRRVESKKAREKRLERTKKVKQGRHADRQAGTVQQPEAVEWKVDETATGE